MTFQTKGTNSKTSITKAMSNLGKNLEIYEEKT